MTRTNHDNSPLHGIRRIRWQWLAATFAACLCGIAAGYLAASLPSGRAHQPQVQTAPQAAAHQTQHQANIARAITFSASMDPLLRTTSPLLPASAQNIYGFFQLPKGVDAQELTARWTWNGQAADPKTAHITASPGAKRRAVLKLDAPTRGKPFAPGIGEVQILKNGRRFRQGAFVLAQNAGNILRQDAKHQPTVHTIVAARGVTKQGKPREKAQEFRPNEEIAIVFEYRGALPGDSVVIRWYCEGQQLRQAATMVNLESWNGRAYAWIRPKPQGELLPGEYRARVYSKQSGKELADCCFTVVEDAPGPQPSP